MGCSFLIKNTGIPALNEILILLRLKIYYSFTLLFGIVLLSPTIWKKEIPIMYYNAFTSDWRVIIPAR
jgi:hypothetical protein